MFDCLLEGEGGLPVSIPVDVIFKSNELVVISRIFEVERKLYFNLSMSSIFVNSSVRG